MNKQLKVFAAFGIGSIVFFALGTLFVQHCPVLVEKCIEILNIKPHLLSREEGELLDEKFYMVYEGCRLTIFALSFRLLDLAYASLGGTKATRSCANWGTVGCRLALVCVLLCLLRDVLLKRGGAMMDSLTVMLDVFSFASSCALGVSVIMLARMFCTNAVLVKMCVIGALGWFFVALEDLLLLFPSTRTDLLRFIRDHFTCHCYFWYATEACRLLPFIGVLFVRKLSPYWMGPDGSDDGEDERERVWDVCAVPLFWLVFVAIPLCIVPLCITYPFFTKHLFFVSYRLNVLFFKIFSFSLGAFMAFVNFRTVLPYLNRTDLGRLFGTLGERLRKFAYAVCAVKQIRLPRRRDSSAAGKEKVPEAKARDRLVELKQLLDDGLITQAEFEQKRASILSEV